MGQQQRRLAAFLTFYGFHLAVMPVMSLCSLAGTLVQRLERRAHEGGHNPTRSLDVALLVAAALGQIAISYFSLVAALGLGAGAPLAHLELPYALLSLLELGLQNVFIIEGLHRHPSLRAGRRKRTRSIFKVPAAPSHLESGKTGRRRFYFIPTIISCRHSDLIVIIDFLGTWFLGISQYYKGANMILTSSFFGKWRV